MKLKLLQEKWLRVKNALVLKFNAGLRFSSKKIIVITKPDLNNRLIAAKNAAIKGNSKAFLKVISKAYLIGILFVTTATAE